MAATSGASMPYRTTQPSVRRPLTFAGLTCACAPYIFILAFFAGSGQVCFAQTDEAIKSTAIGVLHSYYATQDPHYSKAVARLPEVQSALDELKTAVTAAQTARPGQFAAEFESCLKVVAQATRRVNRAVQEKDVVQYG